MNIRQLFFFILLSSPFIPAQKNSLATFPPEWKEIASENKNIKVIRLTSSKTMDCGLYFYNDGFNLEDSTLIFVSERCGKANLFLMNLRTGSIEQLTDEKKIKARGATYCAKQRMIYYSTDKEIKSYNTATKQIEVLFTIPDKYYTSASLSSTRDGKYIAFAELKKPSLSTGNKNSGDTNYHSIIYIINTAAKTTDIVTKEDFYISHVVINPVDFTKIIYCHEGDWDTVKQRMWYINSDGSGKIPLRVEDDAKLRVGHEYWSHDGKQINYQIGKFDKRKYIGVIKAKDLNHYTEFPYADDKHTQQNSTGNLFLGDGMPKSPYISIYKKTGSTLEQTQLYKHNSSYSSEVSHPHPIFSPDNKSIYFTSDSEGNSDIYLVVLNSNLLH